MGIQATQLRKGMVILHNGVLHRIVEYHHHTPGNLRAMVQTKMRNLKTGSTTEHRFRSGEDVTRVVLEKKGKGRKHPVYRFYDDAGGYVCEVRYGGADANALQRGLWTHTKTVESILIPSPVVGLATRTILCW